MNRPANQTHGYRYVGILLAVILLLAATTPAAQAQWLPELRALANDNAQVTALVVDLDDKNVIAALNPDLRLTPASVSKLYAAAGALQSFGPDHRFTTRFATDGKVNGNVLWGDLVFVGGGDPTLDTARLRTLIQRLKAVGVNHITGDLVIDNGLFGHFSCQIKDRCEAHTLANRAYSAPLSAAGINFGTIGITIRPGETIGDPADILLNPLGLDGYIIDNGITTGSANIQPQFSVRRVHDNGSNILRLNGQIPAGGYSYDVYRAVTNADIQTGQVLATLLRDARVTMEGDVVVRPMNGTAANTLASVDSDSLGTLLGPMLTYSNNYTADVLTMDIATSNGQHAPLQLSNASRTLETLARQALQQTWLGRAEAPDPILASGSGLSLKNQLSARHLVALLDYMYHQPALFPSFYGAIPVPISSATNTLKHGNHDWLTRLAAKTGTLTQPVTVRSLAGYFRMQNGHFGAFAVIINGTSARPALSFHETVTAYQQDIEDILAAY